MTASSAAPTTYINGAWIDPDGFREVTKFQDVPYVTIQT